MMEQKLNRFLWCGQDSKAKAKVSWEKICVPKREGGLGLKRLEVWNKAANLSHIWNLFVQAGSLWVAWVEKNWLKGRSFWQVGIPHPCPWSWRKLLKLREIAKEFIRFKIGDGSKTFLWFDNWHPDGCLIEKYGFRVIYDAGSHKEAKVSSIIRNGNLFWHGARSDSIVAIQSKLPEVVIGDADMPLWNSKKGVYSCADAWEILRDKLSIVSCWKVVWFNLAIPRHAFLLWLAFRDALITKDKMCKWGFGGSSLCLFCYARQEYSMHLFFQCSFSRRIWRTLMELCLIADPKVEWDEVTVWCSSDLKGKNLHSTLCKLSLGAIVYHLWRQRNNLLHGNIPKTEESIVAQIKWEVRSKIVATGAVKRSPLNCKLVQNWNLSNVL